jgi:hypothetical protein
MAMTMEQMEEELARLRREVEQDPIRTVLRRILEEMARNDPTLLSPTPRAAPPPDADAIRASARETMRRIRQSRRG